MALPANFEDYVAKAAQHAKDRWSMPDAVVVREWCDKFAATYPDPRECIDFCAQKYDLLDPEELSYFKRSLPTEGTPRYHSRQAA